MRAIHLFLLLGMASAPLLAQTTAPNAAQGSSQGREQLLNPEQNTTQIHQRTQRIHVEDAGSRVDELRVGGQTQRITVQPKTGDLPAYEVQSHDGARGGSGPRSGTEASTAPRVWNVMKF
ncbi:MAG: hypothetical protein PHI55_05125 [Burkholderiaceae bacterium]|nr:hypothetical protein [Burkholderiaceae bacterium]